MGRDTKSKNLIIAGKEQLREKGENSAAIPSEFGELARLCKERFHQPP